MTTHGYGLAVDVRHSVGGAGDDILIGGANDDHFYSGDGSDRDYGSTGNDEFNKWFAHAHLVFHLQAGERRAYR